ncbi:MAG: hypothetical protein M1617_05985 [Actinobacteria bacterium]|nr:hypothetical protein [Actinomycetota bacterium]
MTGRFMMVAVLMAALLFTSGCEPTQGGADAVYTQEVPPAGAPHLPPGTSVEATIVGTGDATALLESRPELAEAVILELPGYLGSIGLSGSHFTVATEVLGGRESEGGAELYIDGVIHWWTLEGGRLEYQSAGEFIGRMRFEESADKLVFSAWDQPLDGALLIPGIETLFPRPYSDRAISRLGPNRAEMWRQGEQLGQEWAASQVAN